METRFAMEQDKNAVMNLWKYSFESDEPYFKWYFDNIYRPDRTLCRLEDGQLLANLQITPYRLFQRGKLFNSFYISGVVTNPDFRGKGIGKNLMADAYAQLKEMSPIVFLMPALPAFYQKLGFVYGYEENLWHIPIDSLSVFSMPAGRWRKADLSLDLPILHNIYHTATNHFNGVVRRSMEDLSNYFLEYSMDGGIIRIFNDGDKDDTYLFYQIKDGVFHIIELTACSHEGIAAALAFTAGHGSEAATLRWHAPSCDIHHLRLKNTAGISRRPTVMIRIINALDALNGLMISAPLTSDLIIEVYDQFCPWNNLTLSLIGEGQKLLARVSHEKPQVSLDIATLSALLWGLSDVHQLRMDGRIKAEPYILSLLAELFPPTRNWIYYLS